MSSLFRSKIKDIMYIGQVLRYRSMLFLTSKNIKKIRNEKKKKKNHCLAAKSPTDDPSVVI